MRNDRPASLARRGVVGRSALLFGAVISLVGCTSAETSSSSGPPSGCAGAARPESDALGTGKVLFDRSGEGDVHTIYLLEAGCEKQLTQPGAYGLGRLSPDHRHMLVMPNGDIPPPITGGTLGLDGKHFQRLNLKDPTLNLVPAAWSPDGSRIAFEGWDDSNRSRTGVYTARASDGGDLVRVTSRPGPRHDIPLDYSPDGRELVFHRSVGVDPDPHVGGSLWVVGVDGKDTRRISGRARPADWARWSPDGRRIMFATQRTAPSGAIWTVSPDGSNLAKLFVDSGGRFPITPTWSPDGSRILFALDPTNDEFTHPNNTLDVIAADGTHLQTVLETDDFKRWPEWWE